jgi:hypothetical protein
MELEGYLAIIAVKEAHKLPSGTEFMVSELFRKTDWDIVQQAQKMQAGKLFYKELEKQDLLNISIKHLYMRNDKIEVYQKI